MNDLILQDHNAAHVQRYNTALEPEEVELMMAHLEGQIGKVDRLCNALILQPRGLSKGVLDWLRMLKVCTAHLQWHREHPADYTGTAPGPNDLADTTGPGARNGAAKTP